MYMYVYCMISSSKLIVISLLARSQTKHSIDNRTKVGAVLIHADC